MPRRPTLKVTMSPAPPLSTKHWYVLSCTGVEAIKPNLVRFTFEILEDENQLGRTVVHTIHARLAPDTPLCRLLLKAFGEQLRVGQSIELLNLVGRKCEARFDAGVNGALQAIVGFRQHLDPPSKRKPQSADPAPTGPTKEVVHGLG